MVKTVVFDLGKVLVDFDYRIAARQLASRSRMDAAALMSFLAREPLLSDYERGKVKRAEFIEAVSAITGFRGSPEEFGASFGDIFTPIAPMVQLHAALRGRGMPTYIFSNTNDLAVEHIRRSFPFYGQFDGYVLSYEHGAMKPEPALYEVVERETGRRGGEIAYLDDRPENAAAGAARDWQAIVHETPEKTFRALAQLGVVS